MSFSAIPSAAPITAKATPRSAPRSRRRGIWGSPPSSASARAWPIARPGTRWRWWRGRFHRRCSDQLAAAELAIAYEPIWAIGTGRTPTVAEVEAVHARIRAALAAKTADPAAVPILYGGSVKPDNVAALMAAADVDGALVGGASLVAADFWAIARACGR